MAKKIKEDVYGGGVNNNRSYRVQDDSTQERPWDTVPDEMEPKWTGESAGDEVDKPASQPTKDGKSEPITTKPVVHREPPANGDADGFDAQTHESIVQEVAPPGWEPTVKAMKHHPGSVSNPWALAWWMKNKGFHPHEVTEYFSKLNEKASLEEVHQWITRGTKQLNEYEIQSHARPIRTEYTEAEQTENELRKVISEKDIEGVSINVAETALGAETIFVNIDNQDVLEKEFTLLVTCQMNDLYDIYLYETTDDGSRPLDTDKEVDWEHLHSRVLEFVDAVLGLIAERNLEDVDSVEGDETNEVGRPKGISFPFKSKEPNVVAETTKAKTKCVLDRMIKERQSRLTLVRRLCENMRNVDAVLKGNRRKMIL